MNKDFVRNDDFLERREHLKNLSDEELKKRFFELTEQVVKPLLDIAYTHTTPAIERSVLLRMGFSSIEAKAIVDKVVDKGLISKGAGNIVYKIANSRQITIREAGLSILESDVIEW